MDEHEYVICPACGHRMKVADWAEAWPYEEGPHTIWCDSCEAEFTFATTITFTFRIVPTAKEPRQ